ncbi:MAG: hypothetical protein NVS2B12_20750 [Ktedonobacteraceae bacterium]
MSSFGQLLSLLRVRILLVVVGLMCELIYVLCFVTQLPLLRYYQGLTDLGYITNHSHTGFVIFVLSFTFLFILLGFAWWEVYHAQYQDRETLWLVLGFGALFAMTMSFVYPVTAIDVFGYMVQSLILLHHHANPMVTPALNFPTDPMTMYAGGWAGIPTPYGPLGILIDALPSLLTGNLAGNNVLANLLLLKGMFSALLIGEAFLVYKILAGSAPKFALAGALFIAWNPLALFEYSANGHNDLVVMLFMLLAILALQKERPVLSWALLIASVLVKYATLPLLPLFFIYGVMHQPTSTERARYIGRVALVSLVLIVVFFAPFWAGPHTLDASLDQDRYFIASFSTLVHDVAASQFTVEKARSLGRVLFGLVYLYALYLSTKSLRHLLQAAFLALFFYLAFATGKFESWYAIWPMMLAISLGRIDETIIIAAFALGATLSAAVYEYLWVWLGLTDSTLDVSNSIAYSITFAPALILYLCFVLRRLSMATPEIVKQEQVEADVADVADVDKQTTYAMSGDL